ncbi:large ribosomal subunit protein mL37-like [Ylistrum balloti]|uniref:large ribosomal subunit protein mL37-like n=1 Tax=Ylistrum balloti TaxID=509963 RepID=UPI00290584BD|nr:large ribosomal subunit protein mL37-like [Ylistrum balloti]
MRVTQPLLKQIAKPFKRAWAAKYPYQVKEMPDIPDDIEISDPLKKTEWNRRKDLEPASQSVDEKELPGYNTQPVWEFTNINRFIEGIKQAQNLTKTVVYSGMPESVSALMNEVEHPDQNDLLKRIILQSQVWDPSQQKLPRRIDKSCIKWNFQREYGIPRNKSIHILGTNMVRLANSLINARYPAAFKDQQLIIQPAFDAFYTFMGEKIVIKSTSNYLLMGPNPLPRFTDEDTVRRTNDEVIPDMYPILPTIDFKSTHFYDLINNIGFRSSTEFHPHIFITSNCDYWNDDSRQARSMMYCLAHTIAEARLRFGKDVQTLPEPICVQTASVGETGLNFVFFQLNTLDFSSQSGVKNQAWLDTGNNLYTKILSQPWNGEEFLNHQYTDFTAEPFSKLLAVMQYGLNPS